MKKKAALTAVASILCASLLAGCSYFPAIKLPEGETTMTVRSMPSKPSESETASQTETAETEPVNPADEADKAYAGFIEGKVSVSTSGCFEKDGGKSYLDLASGTFNLDELKKTVTDAAAAVKTEAEKAGIDLDSVKESFAAAKEEEERRRTANG